MLAKIFYIGLVLYYGFISFSGRSFLDLSSKAKMTPKGKRNYYYHK